MGQAIFFAPSLRPLSHDPHNVLQLFATAGKKNEMKWKDWKGEEENMKTL